jgi:DNA polymerase-1
VYNPTTEELITPSNFKEVVGVPVMDYVSYKAMIGDSSDNIKGISGVGVVTAKEIINWMGYDLFEESGFENIPPSLQKAFTPEARKQYDLAYKLVNLKNLPLTISEIDSSIVHSEIDIDEAMDLLIDLDCWSLVERRNEIERNFNVSTRV